jgi:hypothetical protein
VFLRAGFGSGFGSGTICKEISGSEPCKEGTRVRKKITGKAVSKASSGGWVEREPFATRNLKY